MTRTEFLVAPSPPGAGPDAEVATWFPVILEFLATSSPPGAGPDAEEVTWSPIGKAMSVIVPVDAIRAVESCRVVPRDAADDNAEGKGEAAAAMARVGINSTPWIVLISPSVPGIPVWEERPVAGTSHSWFGEG